MKIVTVTLNPCIDKTFAVRCMMPERKLAVDNVRRYPGGGGLNVARAITRLGGEPTALWSRGGRIGDLLTSLLEAEGIRQVPVPIEGEVRENVIVLDRASDQQYRFGMPGPPIQPDEQDGWMQCLKQFSDGGKYLVFSGSLPESVSSDWYGSLIRQAPPGTRVIVDTKDEALKAALKQGVFLVKPNIHELEVIVGRQLGDDEQIEKAARKLIHEGATEAVLISLGAGGAVLVTAEDAVHIAAPTVPIRSRVGAGDSMVGGLVLALSQKRSLCDAAHFAVAAGAAAVMAEGTELCRREDTERLFAHMHREDAP